MNPLKRIPRNRVTVIGGLLVLVVVSFWMGSSTGGKKDVAAAGDHAAHEEDEATVWTCSMHPQIKMPKPGQCPICFMDLIPLEQGAGDDDEGDAVRLTISENARALAGIATAPVVRRGAVADIRMTGKVALDETRVEMITARIGGRIDKLHVDYTGVPVKRGDHLAEIYSPELIALQRELLEAARAEATAPSTSRLVRGSIQRTFEAAKEKVRLLGFSPKEIERILARETTTDHMTIRANQHGVVLKKLVEEGSYVKEGTPLFHIADLSRVWVMLDAYETDLVWIRLGQKVEFHVEAWPGETFEGTVSFIDPVVDPMTRTVKVRVIAENKDRRLKPDMFVKAVIHAAVSKSGGVKGASLKGKWISPMHPQIVKDHPGTCDICGMPLVPAEELGYVTSGFENVDPLLVPATAPLQTGERAVVYVEVTDTDKPTYEARTVVLGPRVGGSYVVKSGLTEGEMVVINGAFKIDGELQIRAKPSMMSPEGAGGATGHGDHAGSSAGASPQMPDISDKPVSKEFRAQLAPVYETYFEAGEALTKDDLKGAKKALSELVAPVKKVSPPKGEQYEAWGTASKALLKVLEHVDHIEGLPDARSLFEKVSRHVITVYRHYGLPTDEEYFVAFCPMAFGNKGAYWLQEQEKIANPYFGAKMLRCGEIRESMANE